MKNILVIGGAGFIGSNLCKRLVELGFKVTSVDNYSSGTESNHHPGVLYLKGDARDINEIFPPEDGDIKFDVVFHFGEYSRVEESFNDTIETFYSNNQLINVLEFCRKTNALLIYAGSSTKFAENTIGKDLSPYTWTKASNTELINVYSKWYSNFRSRIVYFYNVYGGDNEISEGRFATVIAKFKKCFLKGEPIPVVLPGTQERNFTHIDDVVDGLILIMNYENTYDKVQEFGLGNSKAYSIIEVASMFETSVTFLPERKGNRQSAKLKHIEEAFYFGWKPKRDLRTHIKEFIIQKGK